MSDTPKSVNPIVDAIRAKATRPPISKHVDALDMDLYFRHLTGAESDKMQLDTVNTETGKVEYRKLNGYRARLISLCLCDEQGRAVATAEDVQAWDNDIINEMNDICRKLNKLGKEEVDKEVKD
jgi:hypothetical protein